MACVAVLVVVAVTCVAATAHAMLASRAFTNPSGVAAAGRDCTAAWVMLACGPLLVSRRAPNA